MDHYILSCDSVTDLSREYFDQIDVRYVCFHYSIDGKEYLDDLGETIPLADFYARMAAGAETATSQVNVQEYIRFFEGFLKEGLDILHIALSSGVSGSCNSALIARDTLLEDYPDRKIFIVDSLGASSGYGLLVDAAAEKRAEGMDIESLASWTEQNRLLVHHWFFSTDLTFYIRGGRISKTSGAIGKLLNICPLLDIDGTGRLALKYKIRTKKKVIRTIVDKMEEFARGGPGYDGKCFLSHSACIEDAREVARLVEERFPHLNGKVRIFDIGTTVGSHTGPGTVALFFWGSRRT